MANKRTKGRKLQAAIVEKDWLNELAKTLHVGPAPTGWYTISQICRRLKMGRTAVRNLLDQRKARTQQFYQITTDNRRVLLTHYKI